ncbi:MAG: hypothetical protein ACM34O_00835 [Ignavibacteria bacterium]
MKILLILIVTCTSALFSQNNSSENQIDEYGGQLWIENRMKSPVPSFTKDSLLTNNPKKKNTGLAIIYSLLLPGMGELYAESYSSGKYFTIAEGALWGVYIGMNAYANWQEEKYKSFATSNGGVNTAGKNKEYFANIGVYENIDAYNDAKALERNFAAMYDAQQYYWSWSDNDRKRYRSQWTSSEEAYNNIRFVVGGLILNRIMSAINAVRLVSAYNKRQSSELGWNFSVGILNQVNLPAGISFNFQSSF